MIYHKTDFKVIFIICGGFLLISYLLKHFFFNNVYSLIKRSYSLKRSAKVSLQTAMTFSHISQIIIFEVFRKEYDGSIVLDGYFVKMYARL